MQVLLFFNLLIRNYMKILKYFTYTLIYVLFFTNQPMQTDCLLVVAQDITQSRCLIHLTNDL